MAETETHRLNKAVLAEMLAPGLINVSRKDIREIVAKRRQVRTGIGTGTGPRKFQLATKTAFASAKISRTMLKRMRRLLVYLVIDEQVTIAEINEAIGRIQKQAPKRTDITMGARVDSALRDTVRMTILAV